MDLIGFREIRKAFGKNNLVVTGFIAFIAMISFS